MKIMKDLQKDYNEEWRDIPDYDNYQVSNLGRVKSLNYRRSGNEKLMSLSVNNRGYFQITLRNGLGKKTFMVHKLVAIVFLNHTPNGRIDIVDHIDNNPLNNRADNLQVVTQRINTSKDKNGTSKYTGVSKKKDRNLWVAQISIKDKKYHIGYFKTELEAHEAYKQKELELCGEK